MQIKITTIPLHTSAMAGIKEKNKITSVEQDAEKVEPSYITGENVKWCSFRK